MIALTEQERQILALVTPVAESLGMEIVRLRVQGGSDTATSYLDDLSVDTEAPTFLSAVATTVIRFL